MKIDDGATTVRSFSAASSRNESQPADWDAQFDELYRENRPKLLAYARRRNALDAELVVDQALFDFYRAKERLRSNNSKVYWAYMYRAVDSHLARERGGQVPDPSAEVEDFDNIESFEEQLIDQMNFEEALAMLTPSQASALRLQLVDGMTSAQAGDVLGKTATATRQLQFQALSRLRRLLYGLVIALIIAGGMAMAVLAGGSEPMENTPTDAPVEPPPTSVEGRGDGAPDGSSIDDEGQTLRVDGVDVEPSSGPPVTATDPSLNPLLQATPDEIGIVIASVGSRRCLDIADAENLIQWTCHGDPQQRFISVAADDRDGFYLRLQSTDRCLQVGTASGQALPCDGGERQVFRWVGTELRVHSGLCLTVAGVAPGDNDGMTARSCDGSLAQQFVEAENPGHAIQALMEATAPDVPWAPAAATSELMIKNVQSNLCVDFPGVNDPFMLQFECHGGDNQRFHQVAVEGGFALQLVGSELCLDALLPELSAAMPCTGGAHQTFQWSGRTLVVAQTNSCLTVQWGSIDPRTRIVSEPCDGTASQQFVTASRPLDGPEPEPIVAVVGRITAA